MTSPFVDRVEYQVIGRDTNASRVFRDVADAADSAGSSVDGLGGHIDRLNQNIDDTAARMRALIAAMRGISDVELPAIGGLDTNELERANQQLAAMVVEVDRAGQATVRLRDDLDSTTGSIRTVATTSGDAAASVTTLGGGFDSLRTRVDDSRTAINGISTDFNTLGQSIEDGRVVAIRFRDDLATTAANGRSQVDNLGTGFRNLSTDVETSRGRLGNLFRDIERAGTIDITQHVDVGRQVVESVSSNRDRLERAGLVAGATIGGTLLLALSDAIGGGITGIPIVGPLMVGVVAALAEISGPLSIAVAGLMSVVAVAAAVTLTAALGAAILAAFAGGAIVAGILIQLRDPAVKKAFTDTGNLIIQQFQQATSAFVPAVVQALIQVRSAVEKMEPQLQDFFTAAASYVAPLTQAIIGFVQSALPGATKAMQSLGPIFEELAKWAPKLGKTIGDFFERLSKHVPALAQGLGYVIGFANEAIKFFGIIIELSAEAMGGVARLWNLLGKLPWAHTGEAVGDVFRGIQIRVGDLIAYMMGTPVQAAGKNLADSFKPIAKAKEYVAGVVDETEQLAQATRDAIKAANDFLGLGDAQSSMYEAMEAGAKRAGSAAKKDLAKGIDFSSAAGRENWKVLRDIAGNANRAASEITTMGGSAADAAGVVQAARDSFIKVAMSMNYSADEAQILADKMFGIPDADPTATFHDKASAGIGGVDSKMDALDRYNASPSAYLRDNASGDIGRVQAALRRLNGSSATVTVYAAQGGSTIYHGLASGGRVPGPGLKGVDSKLMLLAPGEHVLSAAEVDAAGGHRAIESFRRSLLHKGSGTGEQTTTTMDRPTGGGMDGGARFASTLRQALSGMTLVIDDRTGRTAQLIARGG